MELPLQPGPVGRAIAQVDARRWTLYTSMIGPRIWRFSPNGPCGNCQAPTSWNTRPGPDSKYLLLLPSEFENWPKSAPPITVVAKFQDQSAEERFLARTRGVLPPPFGPNPLRQSFGGQNGIAPTQRSVRR